MFKYNENESVEENLSRAYEDGDVHWSPGYAEPGYDESEKGVLFANWNETSHFDVASGKHITTDKSMKILSEKAEEEGYGIEWSDEWTDCNECQKSFRTSPDSYGWGMHGAEIHGDMVCGDCIVEDPEDYLDLLRGNSQNALSSAINIDLEEHGYTQVNKERRFETGLHPGQNDSPEAIGETLEKAGITDFIFTIDSKGQFDLDFSVWVQGENYKKAVEALKQGTTTHPPGKDPATLMKRGLLEASAVMASLPGPGIKVITIDKDGSVSGKSVSPEDFVAGKALNK